MAGTSEPGSNCKHGCLFELCPYPPKGEESYRAELSEAFCRQAACPGEQRPRSAARQRHGRERFRAILEKFWTQMGTGRTGSKSTTTTASTEGAALADAAGRRRPRSGRRS